VESNWVHSATNRHIVPAPVVYDDEEIGGMIGRGNRSTLRKPAPVPICPPQTPHATRTRTRAAAVGSQRLPAWATARPHALLTPNRSWSSANFIYLQRLQSISNYVILQVLSRLPNRHLQGDFSIKIPYAFLPSAQLTTECWMSPLLRHWGTCAANQVPCYILVG
jgi:hypothetical protein